VYTPRKCPNPGEAREAVILHNHDIRRFDACEGGMGDNGETSG